MTQRDRALVLLLVLGLLSLITWPVLRWLLPLDLLVPRTWGSRDARPDHPDRELGSIHVSVVGALREPLAGATLSVHRSVLDDVRGTAPIATVVTDAQGEGSLAKLPDGELHLRVSKPGYTSYAWTARLWSRRQLDDRRHVELYQARRITGTVSTQDGAPIPGAHVVGSSAVVNNDFHYEYADAESDALGRFVLERLPASVVFVAAYAADHAGATSGPLDLGQDAVRLTLSRAPTAHAAFTAKTPSGDPVRDVCLELELHGDPLPRCFRAIDLGDLGARELRGLPERDGVLKVTCSPSRLMDEYLRSVTTKTGATTRVDLVALGPAWAKPGHADSGGARICGRVRWHDGRPASDVSVRLVFDRFMDPGHIADQATGPGGEFCFSDVPDRDGAVYVEAEAEGSGMVRGERAIEIVPGTVLNGLELELDAPCHLSGIVRSAQGLPCRGVAVVSAYLAWHNSYELDHWTITDDQGRFVLDCVRAGATRLYARRTWHAWRDRPQCADTGLEPMLRLVAGERRDGITLDLSD